MKSYKIIAAAALVLTLSACQGGKAKVDCTVADVPSGVLVLNQLNGSVPELQKIVGLDKESIIKAIKNI